MIISLRDTTVVEIVMSGNTNPPDRQQGQHGNMNTTWWRVPGGEWEYRVGSMIRLIKIAEISDNIGEFRQLLEHF